jgi:hypothetical protein
MNGKGDTPRPLSVDAGTWQQRWARTFGQTPMRGFAASVAEPDEKPHTAYHERDREGNG